MKFIWVFEDVKNFRQIQLRKGNKKTHIICRRNIKRIIVKTAVESKWNVK